LCDSTDALCSTTAVISLAWTLFDRDCRLRHIGVNWIVGCRNFFTFLAGGSLDSGRALLAFVILGGFSIGFYLIPATIAFLLAGFLLNRIEKGPFSKSIGLFLITAILQATLMVMLVHIA
jgi:hypothetical protein